MAIIEDVEVTIVSTRTGQRLVEFQDPAQTIPDKARNVCRYIEVVSGEEFKVVVRLKKGFQYHGADGIAIHLRLDGNALHRVRYEERDPRKAPSGVLRDDLVYEYINTKVGNRDSWSEISFSFGAADIDEDLHLDKNLLDRQFEQLGRIAVKVDRVHGKEVKRDLDKEWRVQPAQKLDKKLIVKSISHTFKPGTTKSVKAPSGRSFRSTAIKGRHGKPFTYKFFYRSYLALQNLGCIPSTPEPVPLSERSPSDMKNEEMTDHILQLRAENATQRTENTTQRDEIQRLTQLVQAQAQEVQEARDLKAKMAAFVGNSATSTASTPPSANMKTERIKTERIKRERPDETSTPTRPAKRPKPEYVDLD